MTFPNGKKYIGQTKKIENRWGSSGARYKRQVVYKAIEKYGWDNIIKEILVDNLTESEVDYYEQYYIAVYDTISPHGYNVEYGGNSTKTLSPQTIEKIRQHAIGYPQTKIQRERSSISHKKYFAEHPEMREHLANKTRQYYAEHPEAREHLREIRKTQKHHRFTEEERKKIADAEPKREVIQLTDSGEIVCVHRSVTDAAKSVNGSPANITATAKGRHKIAYGYQWKYADELMEICRNLPIKQ